MGHDLLARAALGHDACAHFSDILAEGHQVLKPSDCVGFEIIQRRQDGFDFVATNIHKL
ncbi:hypothetical protein SAMN05216275_15816 [Streptosporangium canum]|uniref:Uncharacterized protein n=1 Tax=Streptosporangium canum TaxID=324952 RepID=A0A1I4F7U8_9ACTN|nr:hypothetical protein [Streptosporangium canum]SFL13523.1 hypothetical protein SAMN05216275_15816 [Streptosporangium canum]